MDIVKKLIAFGYFFKEIPPEFHSEDLANSIDKINFDSFSRDVKNKWAKPVLYSVPKSDNFRRIKSIPAPIHQIQLCKLIWENWSNLEDHFGVSTVSMTTPKISETSNRAIESKIPISEKMHIRMNHLHNKKYILQTDISRYFSTIYTHVIPWALHTKDFAKEKIGKNILGNKLDTRIQNMQDGQTFGIPLGPVTSQIISEIIGTAIDKDFKNQMGFEVPGFRYTDDIEYYFDSEDNAKNALSKLHKIVNEYQLELNPAKTKILKAPIEFEAEWQQYFTRFRFRETTLGQKSDINSFFSNAFKHKSEAEEKGILSYALKVVRKEVIHKENWGSFESLLLHSGFSDSNSLPIVLEIIEGYNTKGYDVNIIKIKEFIEELIEINFSQNNHYEVSWALVFAKRLNINLNSNITSLLVQSDNSIICILTMILHSKGLLEGYFDTNKYKSYLTTKELYGSQWLFAYEAYKQGWLKPYTDPDYVLEDPFFKILYENGVSFLRSDVDLLKLKDEVIKKLGAAHIQSDESAANDEQAEEEIVPSDESDVSDEQTGEETVQSDESAANDEQVGEETVQSDESAANDEQAEEETVPSGESDINYEQAEEETIPSDETAANDEQAGEETVPSGESDVNDEQAEEETVPSDETAANDEQENLPNSDDINDIFERSIYSDNEWLITLLSTDIENNNKINFSIIDKEY